MDKRKVYEKFNHDARVYFEDLDNQKIFQKDLDCLEKAGVLFFIKYLYEYSKEYSIDVVIYDNKHLYDEALDFLQYFNFKIDNRKEANKNVDMFIELVGDHPFSVNDFINRNNDDLRSISFTPDEEEYYYYLLPLKDIDDFQKEINLHFDSYGHLAMSDNKKEVWSKVDNSFFTYIINK